MILLAKEKTMNELYENFDYSNLKFEYAGPTKDVSFYEYMDSRELFDKIKNNQIRFDDALKKQKKFFKKISEIKLGKKTAEQKEVIDNLGKSYLSREEVINFFKDYSEIILNAGYKAKQNKTTGTGLKILTPKQMHQRLPIALP